MKVFYKCRCLDHEVSLEVRNREPAEDVVDWMDGVVVLSIGRNHASRSPLCQATKMEYVKIPLPENAPFVGGKPVTH